MSDDSRPSDVGLEKYERLRKSADRTHLCNAPVTNLYFRTDGLAEPCWLQIGDGQSNKWSPDNSIMDIWNSRFMSDLRDDLADARLEGRCAQCRECIDQGTRPLALAYEDVEPNPGYEYPAMLELELSNRCNLECVMCQGTLSHLIRKNREHLPPLPEAYDDTFVEQLREVIPHVKELRFNGGEPFTQQMVFDVCEQVYELNPGLRITIATNGTVLNERVKSHLDRGNFHINISIDSLRKERYEAIRIRGDHDVLMSNFEYFKEYCERRDRILSVMINPMRSNWDEMGEMMEWATGQGVHCWYNVVRYPLHSAIWNLPSEEIQRIHDVLSRHQFVRDPEVTKDYIFDNNMTAWHHLVDDQLPAWISEQREREERGETAHNDDTVPLSLGRKPAPSRD